MSILWLLYTISIGIFIKQVVANPSVIVSDKGKLYSLLKISPSDYWLRPSSHAVLQEDENTCNGTSQICLDISFWSEKDLRTSEALLIKKGHCKSQACRVMPLQIRKVRIIDQNGEWTPSFPWYFVGGAPKDTIRFIMKRTSCASNCSRITANNIAQLSSLVLEIFVAGEAKMSAADKQKLNLIFNFAEIFSLMPWLQRSSSKKMPSVVRRQTLRRLATKLLNRKKLTLGLIDKSFSISNSPSLIESIEQAIVLTAVIFNKDSYHLPVASDAKQKDRINGEVVYLLRSESPYKSFSIEIPQNSLSEVIQISLYIQNDTKTEEEISNEICESSSLDKLFKLKMSKLESRIKAIETKSNPIPESLSFNARHASAGFPQIEDCHRVEKAGVYFLRKYGRKIHCSERGEMTVLRRNKDDLSFNRTWTEYVKGFGDPQTGDFWIGLKFLADYTSSGITCMRLELSPWNRLNNTKLTAMYNDFQIHPKSDNYSLNYSNYSGNLVRDVLGKMKGQMFSTKEHDNDGFSGNCAAVFGNGNWYNACTDLNMFGKFPAKVNRNLIGRVTAAMCAKYILSSEGDMCTPLQSLKMHVTKATKSSNRQRRIVHQWIANSRDCQMYKNVTITTTGIYVITAGGGAGYRTKGSYAYQMVRGGHGALAQAEFFFHRGTELLVLLGCDGRGNNGNGGGGTWLLNKNNSDLLLVAGGGGTGKYWFPSMDGQSTPYGGKARVYYDGMGTHQIKVLRDYELDVSRHCAIDWKIIRRNLLSSRYNRKLQYWGYSGGSGYTCGFKKISESGSSGGGGSFCHPRFAKFVKITAGGNPFTNGFILFETYTCPGYQSAKRP